MNDMYLLVIWYIMLSNVIAPIYMNEWAADSPIYVHRPK